MEKKVYVIFEGEPEYTLKVALSAESPATITDLLQKFVTAYNTKKAPATLNLSKCVIATDKYVTLPPSANPFQYFSDGQEAYCVIQDPESDGGDPTKVRTCTRQGCKKQYTNADNAPNSCCFHPKAPIFHEGLKGWSCCSKRVSTFNEFLEIPGCATGSHTDEAQETSITSTAPPKTDPAPTSTEGGVEVYVSKAAAPPKPKVAPPTAELQPPPVENDPEGATIIGGSKCRRNGCGFLYKDQTSYDAPCVHHPGYAIFHEASKYWSCCKPRAAEFDEFLKIEGCVAGRHKFLPFSHEKIDPNEVVCRYDFYQMGDFAVVNVYAKNTLPTDSNVLVEPTQVTINIKFKDGKFFKKVLLLANEADPASSKYEFLSTKLELKIRKKDPTVSWTQLERK